MKSKHFIKILIAFMSLYCCIVVLDVKLHLDTDILNFNMFYKYILSISLVLLPLATSLQNGDSFGDGKISTLHIISKLIFWLVNIVNCFSECQG